MINASLRCFRLFLQNKPYLYSLKTKLFGLFDQFLDVGIDIAGEKVPGVAFDGGAVGGDEKLLEVPGDVGPPDRLPDEELGVSHEVLGVVAGGGQAFL